MIALSYKQPYPTLVALGIKPIENRTWKLPEKYKGKRTLIHASATPYRGLKFNSSVADALTDEQYTAVINAHKRDLAFMDFYPYGAIIGSVEIVDCVINHPSIWAEKSYMEFDGFSPSCYHTIYNWVLANPILFDKPIPCKGKLSFWDYPNILAEPEEKDGELYCHCQIPVEETDQVTGGCGDYRCRYCGGKWYK